jgi:hypothetical protein
MTDKFRTYREATRNALFTGSGATSPELRAAVAAGNPPPPLAELVAKIRTRAYTITDEDIQALRGAYDDEALFEIILSAAYGTASDQLAAARRALEDA